MGPQAKNVAATGASGFCMAEVVNLRTMPGDTELAHVLYPSERARFVGIRRTLRQRQFLAGHWLVRQLACERCGGVPTDWRWCSTPRGEPGLFHKGQAICVSVSHRGDWLACAISSQPVWHRYRGLGAAVRLVVACRLRISSRAERRWRRPDTGRAESKVRQLLVPARGQRKAGWSWRRNPRVASAASALLRAFRS